MTKISDVSSTQLAAKPALRKRVVYLTRFLYYKYVAGFQVSDEPHFDSASTQTFNALLNDASCYLEFGSGGSTLSAARRGKDTLSVDSDAHFAKAVRRRLPANATCKILTPNIGLTGEWGMPLFKEPTRQRLRRWRRYVDLPFETLSQRSNRFPDLILIDGRFRRACALESARQAQLRGISTTIFFDDYIDRDYYHDVERYLGQPQMIGRAAIFRVGSGPQIPESVIADAASDYR